MTVRSLVLAGLALASLGSGSRAFAQATSGSTSAAAPAPGDNLNFRFADGIIAICEDKVITVEDVRNAMQPFIADLQRASKSEQDYVKQETQLEDTVINQLIDRVLIIKEFRKDEKKHIPDGYIDQAIADDLSNRFDNDRSKFLAFLRAKGETIKEYRKDKEEEIIYDYETHQQRKSLETVSPMRIEQFYKENKEQFYQEDAVDLRMIQLASTNGETDAVLQERAKSILERFRAGEKFEDLAKEYSQDLHRSKGGEWGEMKRTQLIPEFGDAVFKLKKGEATEPITYQHAVYVLFVQDRKYAGIQPLSAVHGQIEQMLRTKMAQEATEHWLERLRRNGYVKHF